MRNQEKDLRQTIEELQEVPLPVADRFAALTEFDERRSVYRDYALFGAGVVVSTVIGVILELAF